MRTMGVDIASVGKSALALAIDLKPKRAFIWQPEHHRDSESVHLNAWRKWLLGKFIVFRPEVVAVEQLAVFLNKKTIRALSHFEGVALEAAKDYGAIVVNPTAGSSRNIVLDIPANSNKEAAWAAIKILYPNFPFGKANQGGMDKADAMVHALAATIHLERGGRSVRKR
jgi:Holliday junction resolvasome RuvABC endonuclease subunit